MALQGPNNQNYDLISKLPDKILHHILSFLPTTEAVCTSILSTRWRHVWTGLPNIDLDDRSLHLYTDNYDDYVPFLEFVERLLTHRKVPDVAKFSLACTVKHCPSRVCTWISSAIWKNVIQLTLLLDVNEQFTLPTCVFNCESLRDLQIRMKCVLKLPQRISLPNLRALSLAEVRILNAESRSRLFSGFPSLEEVCLYNCNYGSYSSFTISLPSLRRLRIYNVFLYGPPSNKTVHCTIIVEAPNLFSLEYGSELPVQIFLKKHCLAEASVLVVDQPERKMFHAHNALRIFDRLENIKDLHLSTTTIKFLFLAVNRLSGPLPVLGKLTHMILLMEINNYDLEALVKFLAGCPVLETLVLCEQEDFGQQLFTADCVTMSASEYSLPSLKTITLDLLNGSLLNMYGLKGLVEIAPALDKIEIDCSKTKSIDAAQKNDMRLTVERMLQGLNRSIAISVRG